MIRMNGFYGFTQGMKRYHIHLNENNPNYELRTLEKLLKI